MGMHVRSTVICGWPLAEIVGRLPAYDTEEPYELEEIPNALEVYEGPEGDIWVAHGLASFGEEDEGVECFCPKTPAKVKLFMTTYAITTPAKWALMVTTN